MHGKKKKKQKQYYNKFNKDFKTKKWSTSIEKNQTAFHCLLYIRLIILHKLSLFLLMHNSVLKCISLICKYRLK